jgi:hypothetical protein
MGVDTNLNIGPYMIATGMKKVECNETITTCSDKKCSMYEHNVRIASKFCASCGAAVKEKTYTQHKVFSAAYIISEKREFEDCLCCTGVFVQGGNNESMIFVPNQRSPFDKERDLDDDGAVELTNANAQAEIDWFKETYGKIIEYLHDNLGPDSVEVKWGIVKWYS